MSETPAEISAQVDKHFCISSLSGRVEGEEEKEEEEEEEGGEAVRLCGELPL